MKPLSIALALNGFLGCVFAVALDGSQPDYSVACASLAALSLIVATAHQIFD